MYRVGFIETREFVQHFLRMSRIERDRHMQMHLRKSASIQRMKEDHEKSFFSKFVQNPVSKITAPTDEDKDSFLSKLRSIAVQFDVNKFPILNESNFEVVSVSHTEFTASMKKSFGLHLTPGISTHSGKR
jgi:hypothetical protein